MIEKDNISTLEWVEKIRIGKDKDLKKVYFLYREEFTVWIKQKFNLTNEDIKDLYQDSILVLYQNIKTKQFTGEKCTLKTYLFAIGRNISINKLRKAYRTKEYLVEQEIMTNAINEESIMAFFDDIDLENKSIRTQKIIQLLNKLNNPCRDIIILFYFERLSMYEISEKLNYADATVVKSQKYRCMAKLLKVFGKL